jgi:hypothetical protein
MSVSLFNLILLILDPRSEMMSGNQIAWRYEFSNN